MRDFPIFRHNWLLFSALLFPVLSIAQVTQQWVARYNGPGNSQDGGTAFFIDAPGNVYVGGNSTGSGTDMDIATVKYNAAGVQQWVARYNGPANGHDHLASMAGDALGNVYVTGTSAPGDNFYATVIVTIKYNSAGVQQWLAIYNGAANSSDDSRAIVVDALGNVYVAGTSSGVGTGTDIIIIKYNSAGVQQWEKRYNGPANDSDGASRLSLGKDGYLYVTGFSTGIGTNSDFITIKYNTAGVLQWDARYDIDNASQGASLLALDAAGNVYVSGAYATDYVTVKYDNNGNLKWANKYNGSLDYFDEPYGLAADNNGNVYVTGMSNMEPFYDPGDPASAEYATIKYDASGNQLWIAKYNGPVKGYDRPSSLALDASGNIYVTGESAGLGTGPDYATVKYNNDGIQQWEARYNGPGSKSDWAAALAIDAIGNVYVTGSSYAGNPDTSTWFDFATIKYSQHSMACGNNADKVLVCHKGKKTICINEADVSSHISHGDQLGECSANAARVSVDESRFSTPGNELPDRFRVYSAPNPASFVTKIYFELPTEGHVNIKIFNVLGKEVTTLLSAVRKAGHHSSELNVSMLPKGLYLYRIIFNAQGETWVESGKFSVVK